MAGGGGSSRQSAPTTTTTSQKPWSAQVPYLKRGFEEAERIYESDKPEYYPGSTVTPYSPDTEAALDIRREAALDPGSTINLAGEEVGKTIRGDYLSPSNPVYQHMLEGVTRSVRPGVDSSRAAAGRFGSPLHAEALGRGVTQGMLPYISQERGRQYGATADAGRSLYGADILGGVGAAREVKSREALQEEIDRHNFEQNREQAKLREYLGAVSPAYGSQTTSTGRQPIYGSDPLQQGLGTALVGSSLLSSAFGGGGYMAGK